MAAPLCLVRVLAPEERLDGALCCRRAPACVWANRQAVCKICKECGARGPVIIIRSVSGQVTSISVDAVES